MRLTRLDITGFKSFGDRTVLAFQPGITAVVGPNGCGKSNIADAILWCLGEQSPKTLRGDRMEDVLFNGSARRPPAGLAEVSLTLGGVRPEELGHSAGGYTEITITRRLYRSGESEYLLNRVSCRLKDIRDLLIETGAGAKGHTVLEQGKVDDIINASPLERRTLVEETAGITKYKIRKTEALRKLEATEHNLLRVRDIIGEVKRQLASLDRQAKKAERYRLTHEELKTLEVGVSLGRYRKWMADAAALSAVVDRERLDEARLAAELGAIAANLETGKAGLGDLDRRFQATQTDLAAHETRAQQAQSRQELLAAQVHEWRGQSETLIVELDGLERALAELQTEDARCAAECAAADSALEQQARLLSAREDAVEEIDRSLADATAGTERIRHRVFQAQADIASATNMLATLAARRSELEKRRERYQENLQAAREEILSKETAKRECEAAHQLHARSFVDREAERTALRGASVGRQAALQEGEAVLTVRREELMASRARLESLAALQRDLVGYDEGVRRVLHAGDSAPPLPGLLGVVADVLDIPPSYERAIEAVLGDRLQGVVAQCRGDILAALETLDAQHGGRARFVPTTPRTPKASPDAGVSPSTGICRAAVDLVGCRIGFEALRVSLLASVVLVDDRATAERCWQQDRLGMTFVTLAGEVFHPSGEVSGGIEPRPALGLLERKRTIKALEAAVAVAVDDLLPLETSVAALRSALEADRGALRQIEDALRENELLVVHDQKAGESLAQELVQLQRRLELLSLEENAAREELDAIAAAVGEQEAAVVSFHEAKAREELALLAQSEMTDRLKTKLAEATAAVTEVRLMLATQREKREHAAVTLRKLSERKAELGGQASQKGAQRHHLEERIAAALSDRERAGGERDQAAAAIADLKQAVSELGSARAAQMHRLRELEDAERMRRREADGLQHRLQTVTVSLAETRLRAAQLTEDILNRYHIDLAASAAVESTDALPEASEEVDAAIARLKETIAQMGVVNLAAIEEYRELETRHAFLAAQETDLTQSMSDLHAAIAKINQTTRDLFVDAFGALNAKFGEVYASFFEGGYAELRLENDAHPLESGVDIIAQPPGKKLRHISLLSGGEKALTAISLLFASFLIHPSPFCVMDEIDAPLDEENVRRFTRALRPMTAHSQFLVVTHNRRTMEQADVLYGVTMEEPGISKLVSVKLQSDTAVEVEIEAAELSL